MSSGGENVRKMLCLQEQINKVVEGEQLMNETDFLKKKIEQELLCAKKNCKRNRREALQALRRKKWYEKHLKNIDYAVKAMTSAHEHIEIMKKVNDLIRDIRKDEDVTQDKDVTQDISTNVYSSVPQEVNFDEEELLAELERLKKSLDESLFEAEREEDKCSAVLSTSSSHPAKMEEEDIEDDLEYLRRWASKS